MPRRIEDSVAKNRSGRKRLESYSIEVSSDATRDYVFTGNTVEVTIGIEVYTRPLGDGLIVGHPDASHGIGRGQVGDFRGSWSLVTDTEQSAEFTKGGRESVIDALAGNLSGIAALLVGTGTGAAAVGDTALGSQTASTFAFGLKDADPTTRARGQFLFAEYGDTVTEFGVEGRDGALMARATTSTVDPSNEKELKVGMTFTFEGNGIGDAVVTSAGEKAVADAIKLQGETVGLKEVAIGSGTTAPAKSDTSLETQIDKKNAARESTPETVRAYTKWYKSEPSPEQPVDVSEIGVIDNAGNLVWRAVFDAFEKNDAFPFQGGATIRVI